MVLRRQYLWILYHFDKNQNLETPVFCILTFQNFIALKVNKLSNKTWNCHQ